MKTSVQLLVLFISFLHFYFLVLEMFFWTKPLGLKVFKQSLEQARASAALAANQGLYNGFLSAGLLWGAFHPTPEFGNQIQVYFLICVVVAGAYGAYSVNKRIFFIQSVPALLALAGFAYTTI